MMRSARRVLTLIATGAALLVIHMLLLAGAAPVVRVAAFRLPGWPAGARPMRLVLLSDIHLSTPGDTPARLAQTVARVLALRPDAVLIAGDLISTLTSGVQAYGGDATIAPLAPLARRVPTFAVLGNHDQARPDEVRAALQARGIAVLANQATRLGPIAIVGIGDAYTWHADGAAAWASWQRIGGVPIVFTHSPDVTPKLPPAFRIVLAGHTHCGQIRLPLIGALSTHSRYGQRYGCGLIREGGRAVIVSAGLGISNLPIRLGAAPDLWLVTVGG